MKRIIAFSILILTVSACSTENNDLKKNLINLPSPKIDTTSIINNSRRIMEMHKDLEKLQKKERELYWKEWKKDNELQEEKIKKIKKEGLRLRKEIMGGKPYK